MSHIYGLKNPVRFIEYFNVVGTYENKPKHKKKTAFGYIHRVFS